MEIGSNVMQWRWAAQNRSWTCPLWMPFLSWCCPLVSKQYISHQCTWNDWADDHEIYIVPLRFLCGRILNKNNACMTQRLRPCSRVINVKCSCSVHRSILELLIKDNGRGVNVICQSKNTILAFIVIIMVVTSLILWQNFPKEVMNMYTMQYNNTILQART